jgi:hypothetical protein
MAKIVTNGPIGHGTRIIQDDGSELHGVSDVVFEANCDDLNRIKVTLSLAEIDAEGVLEAYRHGRRIAKVVYMDGHEEVFGQAAQAHTLLVKQDGGRRLEWPREWDWRPGVADTVLPPSHYTAPVADLADLAETIRRTNEDCLDVAQRMYEKAVLFGPAAKFDAAEIALAERILTMEDRPLADEDRPDRAALKRQREQLAAQEQAAKDEARKAAEADSQSWKPRFG